MSQVSDEVWAVNTASRKDFSEKGKQAMPFWCCRMNVTCMRTSLDVRAHL
ncbi:MAG: hypothetical protein IKR48_11925 [Kiritimatiellae bacterium]|nr:hypothetical protein [Kiritimatiellia bacterium]